MDEYVFERTTIRLILVKIDNRSFLWTLLYIFVMNIFLVDSDSFHWEFHS